MINNMRLVVEVLGQGNWRKNSAIHRTGRANTKHTSSGSNSTQLHWVVRESALPIVCIAFSLQK
ncbi:hypothetical protein GUJ93_ZPchr0006g43255 [Zizania palustris]|uniref:Uncharacterized protein n=1 Tax=Zizania palustris TaxID=103762 RepID=A0A8J5W1H6_ZIZPA|nr:hypothetical protein GUJ93_ZPchr0006g43255 [Zizania palustris]